MISPGHIIGHRDWSPTRKTDPGPFLVDQIRDWAPGPAGGLHMDTDVKTAFGTLDAKLERLLASNTRVEATLRPLVTAVGAQADDEVKALAAIKDARTAVLAGLAALPTAGLSEQDVQRLGASIAELVPALDADRVIDALGVRLLAPPAPAGL